MQRRRLHHRPSRPAGSGDADPWNLLFRFHFSSSNAGSSLDNRGLEIRSGGAGGLDISHQVALATGIAYYHRKHFWNEYPNLLNPFWRATLVAADVDRQGQVLKPGGNDIPNSLDPWQGAAYRSLVQAGFKGVH